MDFIGLSFMNASCFSLDSSIPFVFIISVSFSFLFFLFLCMHDVAGLCGLGSISQFQGPNHSKVRVFSFFLCSWIIPKLLEVCYVFCVESGFIRMSIFLCVWFRILGLKFAMYFALYLGLSEWVFFCLCLVQDFGVEVCYVFCVESGFIRMGIFLCVFGLGFWGFGFDLAVLVCLWALWCWVCVSCIPVFSPV